MQKIIYCSVSGNTCTITSKNLGALGSYSSVSIYIMFDDAWDGMYKKAVFNDSTLSSEFIVAILSENLNTDGYYVISIPDDLMNSDGDITLSIAGYSLDDDSTIECDEVTLYIGSAVMPDKYKSFEDVTPERAEQLADQINSLVSKVDSVENMGVTATSSLSGTSATVTKTIEDDIIYLNFTIPTGDTGEQGIQGEKGDTGDTGFDLSDIYTKDEVDALLPIRISQSEYDELYEADELESDRIYFVAEFED